MIVSWLHLTCLQQDPPKRVAGFGSYIWKSEGQPRVINFDWGSEGAK